MALLSLEARPSKNSGNLYEEFSIRMTTTTMLARTLKDRSRMLHHLLLVVVTLCMAHQISVSHAFSSPSFPATARHGAAVPRHHHRPPPTTSSSAGRTISASFSSTPAARSRRYRTVCCLVSEDEVLEAVDKAEELWAQALEARKTANALSDRAEEEAEAAAANSMEIDELFQTQKAQAEPITMKQLAAADAAAKSNLDAGSMVNKALQALEEAEKLEALAEEALQRSEEILDRHLADFPDSPLAQ